MCIFFLTTLNYKTSKDKVMENMMEKNIVVPEKDNWRRKRPQKGILR